MAFLFFGILIHFGSTPGQIRKLDLTAAKTGNWNFLFLPSHFPKERR
jgi:hypothetical protein